jgi:hypothetical protein
VAKCIAAGLVGGRGIFIDACLIKAAVDKKKGVPGDQPIARPKAEEASRRSPNCPKEGGPCVSTVSIVRNSHWAPAGGRKQVDSCRRNRDVPDLNAVALSRHRMHYR